MNTPIGIFDSGYGGLTILRHIRNLLPQYDYLYLGDNARAPYGTRSFEVVYEFTLQAVRYLFEQGCALVILGCNTASAKALRTIQQNDLPALDATLRGCDLHPLYQPERRVLGVIRPTAEVMGDITRSRHIGILATPGTIKSETYEMEIHKLFPDISVTGIACPMWVQLVESGEMDTPGADYFVEKRINELFEADPLIDAVILGCTHYPLLMDKIVRYMPSGVTIISQGEYVAHSLQDYLHRHTAIDARLSRTSSTRFLTTEEPTSFSLHASRFLGEAQIKAEHINL